MSRSKRSSRIRERARPSGARNPRSVAGSGGVHPARARHRLAGASARVRSRRPTHVGQRRVPARRREDPRISGVGRRRWADRAAAQAGPASPAARVGLRGMALRLRQQPRCRARVPGVRVPARRSRPRRAGTARLRRVDRRFVGCVGVLGRADVARLALYADDRVDGALDRAAGVGMRDPPRWSPGRPKSPVGGPRGFCGGHGALQPVADAACAALCASRMDPPTRRRGCPTAQSPV